MTGPTAAPPFFPYPPRTVAEVDAAEQCKPQLLAEQRKYFKPRGGRFSHCWGCVDRSVCPWPQDCPRCGEMAA